MKCIFYIERYDENSELWSRNSPNHFLKFKAALEAYNRFMEEHPIEGYRIVRCFIESETVIYPNLESFKNKEILPAHK